MWSDRSRSHPDYYNMTILYFFVVTILFNLKWNKFEKLPNTQNQKPDRLNCVRTFSKYSEGKGRRRHRYKALQINGYHHGPYIVTYAQKSDNRNKNQRLLRPINIYAIVVFNQKKKQKRQKIHAKMEERRKDEKKTKSKFVWFGGDFEALHPNTTPSTG